MREPIQLVLTATLHTKYSSSQIYYYSKTITKLVQSKRSLNTINYEDIQYMVDNDQYMKRMYNREQFKNKMNGFKEYYYYHEDCPRIFMNGVEGVYAKWHDRRRHIVYKKLRNLFGDDDSQRSITQSSQSNHKQSNFLHQLSEYNPFSKKYYLRNQAKKQRDLTRNQKNGQLIKTRDQISFLKHDLSNMLKQMNELSMISTLESTRIEHKQKIYHRKTLTQTQTGSCQHSNSNLTSTLKHIFKKKTQINIMMLQPKKNKKLNCIQKQDKKSQLQIFIKNRECSPKLNPVENKQGSLQKLKSKSIFTFVSLGQLGQQNNKIRTNSKRQMPKLNIELRNKNQQKKSCDQNQVCKNEKLFDQINEMEVKKKTITIRSNSIGKIKNNQIQIAELKSRQNSLRKIKTKPDEFNDKKLASLPKKGQIKFSSYKSQHIDVKKALFKIKPPQAVGNKKKRLQLKL